MKIKILILFVINYYCPPFIFSAPWHPNGNVKKHNPISSQNIYDHATGKLFPDDKKRSQTVAVFPISVSNENLREKADIFTERLTHALVASKKCVVVERQYLNQILSEVKLSLTGIIDKNPLEIGKLASADLAILGSLEKNQSGIVGSVRLVHVQTGIIETTCEVAFDESAGNDPNFSQLKYKLIWDGRDFVCKDDEGKRGVNQISINELLNTRNGECSNFSGADLNKADLENAVLRGADFSGVDLNTAWVWNADLTGANLSGAELSYANFGKSIMRRANLENANMLHTALSSVDLGESNLLGVKLEGNAMRQVDLRRAQVNQVDFRNAGIEGVDFRDTDLSGAILGKLFECRYNDNTKLPFDDAEAKKRGMRKLLR